MSDTQDDLTALIAELKDAQASDVTLDLTIGNNGTLQRAIEALERAHFQRRAEPVAESTKTNLIDESGGYWVDGEFRIEGKDLDAMLDRLYTSPPIPASQWLPIETAPKDGTWLILGKTDGPVWANCFWEKMTRKEDRWGSSSGPVPFDPTRWMPLPAAPREE